LIGTFVPEKLISKVKTLKMKKVFALILIAGAFTFTSCGEKKTEEAVSTETTETTEAAPAETETVIDSAAAGAEEAAPATTPVDSTAK